MFSVVLSSTLQSPLCTIFYNGPPNQRIPRSSEVYHSEMEPQLLTIFGQFGNQTQPKIIIPPTCIKNHSVALVHVPFCCKILIFIQALGHAWACNPRVKVSLVYHFKPFSKASSSSHHNTYINGYETSKHCSLLSCVFNIGVYRGIPVWLGRLSYIYLCVHKSFESIFHCCFQKRPVFMITANSFYTPG